MFNKAHLPEVIHHLYSYDAATLERMLADAGFVEIRQRAYGEGVDPVLLRDTRARAIESLYVEAVRPS